MEVTFITGISLSVLFLLILWKKTQALTWIPGPVGLPVLGNTFQVQFHRLRLQFSDWATIYGPVFKVQLPFFQFVIVTGAERIREVCLTKGEDFAGRIDSFRRRGIFSSSGIVGNAQPDIIWRTLRKLSHRSLKQFGEGMLHLSDVATDMSTEMFGEFEKFGSTPMDPREIIRDTTVRTIAFLTTGQKIAPGNLLLKKLQEYEYRVMYELSISSGIVGHFLDTFTWLRYLPLPTSKNLQRIKFLRREIWAEVKHRVDQSRATGCLAAILLERVKDEKSDAREFNRSVATNITEYDAKMTIVNILLAGLATTSMSFTALIAILATRPDIQKTMHAQISQVLPEGQMPTIEDRPNLPYIRAVIWELLRYFTITPRGVPHVAIRNTEVSGIRIPKGTVIMTDLWHLHREKSFWIDPDEFRPERFLDAEGQLLPGDHPRRQHLMPFGAGHRVCLDESLALARLFIWTALLVQKFRILPGFNVSAAADPYQASEDAILRPQPYTVIFQSREEY